VEIFLVRVVGTDLEGLTIAAKVVAKGGIICYPTDTVYGLGCDPLNSVAVEKALKAKGRGTRAMPVLVRALEDAEQLVFLSKSARTIAKRYWPGPLSIVLQAKDIVPSILAPQRTLAVRSPDHAICQQILALCSGMLVGTSANKTGRPASTSADEVVEQLDDSVDLVLDGGKSEIGVASTVVDLTKERVRILREGPIEKTEIVRALRKSR
jgi:L-threonylcarbamoyladenylate synthase